MNVFADAFTKAGINIEGARLAVSANNILAKTQFSPYKSLAKFTEILQTDNGLLRAIAADYLMQRAADMRGESLIGGGHNSGARESQPAAAPADQPVGDERGQWAGASAKPALPLSSPLNADRGGQVSHASARASMPPRSAPIHDGKGHLSFALQSQSASAPLVVKPPVDPKPYAPKPVPRSAITARLRAAQMVSDTILDTYKVRGGIAIGDLSWGEAKTLARTNEREARVLRYITDHAVNVRPGELIRNVVKPEIIQNAVRLAEEAENVAA
jgi:hypothetical protein